ncbi:MAG: hypothetical protein ACRCTP_04130 [Aeromonas popoffii]|uniref:hypothetical protein n=1 Tax=Aeromonas popoffii TaxID=70856 RepID=UPI003F384713
MSNKLKKFSMSLVKAGITITNQGDNFLCTQVGVFNIMGKDAGFAPNVLLDCETAAWVALTASALARDAGFEELKPLKACWASNQEMTEFETNPEVVTEALANYRRLQALALARETLRTMKAEKTSSILGLDGHAIDKDGPQYPIIQ